MTETATLHEIHDRLAEVCDRRRLVPSDFPAGAPINEVDNEADTPRLRDRRRAS